MFVKNQMLLVPFGLIFLYSLAVPVLSYVIELGPVNKLLRCPGLYCGRQILSNGSWSNCGACPRGYRTNVSSACIECNDRPEFYDWLYLGFMVLLALVLHWFSIDTAAKRRSFCKEVLVLHISALFEIVTAAILTLLMSDPVGSLAVRSCRTEKLSDWYTLLHNPNPHYDETLHCTQEAVHNGVYFLRIICCAYAACETLVGAAFSSKTWQDVNLCSTLFLSNLSTYSGSLWRSYLLFLSICSYHFVCHIKCSSFCIQIRSVYAVLDCKYGNRHKKRCDPARSLATSCIWDYCNHTTTRSCISFCTCSLSATTSCVLHSNCSFHRP
ncbi:uncharacterized protein LOC111866497 isoform X2 [Cryptotermes secundus]|uniref:uncharacterized protein LOC111866497 isoform X2 n=1 Tax=Cryptotermes secundus TaxID=105785 RepID=UPI000CD7CAE6|nr:uncharacterized protein LOC111866497 isoform X2 [Cryptotermes secundus]